MIRVFIGYDPREAVAYHVLTQSILDRASMPVSITPLALKNLDFKRKRDPYQSTDFSFTRFLVPHLCNYEGSAIFMDCDMLVQDDIAKLWAMRGENAVRVVKHDYTPNTEDKFLGNKQHVYPKKNWSSLMLFDNTKCTALTKEYVEKSTGMELHQFYWTDDVGDLHGAWNYLVGEPNQYEGAPALIHYTLGGPYFKEYRETEYADEWFDEKGRALYAG